MLLHIRGKEAEKQNGFMCSRSKLNIKQVKGDEKKHCEGTN